MDNISGKRLLILGGAVQQLKVVKAAKAMGAHALALLHKQIHDLHIHLRHQMLHQIGYVLIMDIKCSPVDIRPAADLADRNPADFFLFPQ